VDDVDAAVDAVRAGRPAVLPFDTVYGLCTTPYHEAPVERLVELKGRPQGQPLALMTADVDFLLECVPELRGRAGTIARALLPGPYTLVLPNPARRFRWLSGARPETIGVRVPVLGGDTAAVLARTGALAATSANRHGGAEPRSLVDVPPEIRAAGIVVDGGELPGLPSTVIDFSGDEPRVLRKGAGPVDEAIERARAAVG
jgi:L-threonylcarbamoyladenylate synthase